MFNELLQFLITGVTQTISIEYFIFILIFTEILKGFTYYSPANKRHIFKFDKNGSFPFKSKVLAVVTGVIGSFFIYAMSVPFGSFDGELVKQLIITFAITTSFYELFFFVVIDRFKEILRKVGKAEVKPIIIDLSSDGYDNRRDMYYDYNTITNKDDDDKSS